MSDVIWAAIIMALPATISVVNYFKIKQVHLQINSRVDQLIESVRKEATALEHTAALLREKELAAAYELFEQRKKIP